MLSCGILQKIDLPRAVCPPMHPAKHRRPVDKQLWNHKMQLDRVVPRGADAANARTVLPQLVQDGVEIAESGRSVGVGACVLQKVQVFALDDLGNDGLAPLVPPAQL